MKNLYILSFFVLAIGCNVPNENKPQETTFISASIQQCPEAEFNTTLDTGSYGIEVMQLAHPTAKELVVHTNQDGKLLAEIRRTLPGGITDAFTADINADGHPELYILSQERADSTALLAFELIDDSYTEIVVPSHSNEVNCSYQFTAGKIVETITNKKGETETHRFSLSPSGSLELAS